MKSKLYILIAEMKYKFIFLLISTIGSIIISCDYKSSQIEGKNSIPNSEITIWQSGKLVYSISVTSPDSNEVKTFYHFNPQKVEMYFDNNIFRMIEYGGLSNGNILLNNETKEVYQLDIQNKVAYRGVYSDFSTADKRIQELMPDHYSPNVELTNEVDTILGFPCIKYKILRSGYVRRENDTYIWASDSVNLPPARYDIETSQNVVITPVPMIIGFKDGTILRLTYTADEMEVKYEATEVNFYRVEPEFLTIPSEYEIK